MSEMHPADRSLRRWLVPIALFLAVGAGYELTRPGNRSEAEDAFFYAGSVEDPDLSALRLFHRDHMLYLPLMKGFRFLLHAAGIEGRIEGPIVRLDLWVGALGVALFYGLLRWRLEIETGAAVTGSLLLAFSYGFWRYAVEVEIPVWTHLFAVLLLLGMLAPSRRLLHATLLGGWAGAAILTHGINVVLACAVIPLWLGAARSWKRLGAYALGAALTLVPTFAVVQAATRDSDPGIFVSEHEWPRWTALPKTLIGLGQAVASGNFAWGHRGLAQRIGALFPEKMLDEELLMGSLAPHRLFLASLCTLILLCFAALWVVTARARLGKAAPAGTAAPWFAWWLLVFFAFIACFNPGSFELWVPGLVPFWTLVTIHGIQPLFRGGRRAPGIALVATLGLHNLVGGYAWIRSEASDYNHLRGAWLIEHATEDDWIITADQTEFSKYVDYWSDALVVETFHLRPEQIARLAERLRAAPGKVYVMDEVFQPARCIRVTRPDWCAWLAAFADEIRAQVSPLVQDRHVTIYVLR